LVLSVIDQVPAEGEALFLGFPFGFLRSYTAVRSDGEAPAVMGAARLAKHVSFSRSPYFIITARVFPR